MRAGCSEFRHLHGLGTVTGDWRGIPTQDAGQWKIGDDLRPRGFSTWQVKAAAGKGEGMVKRLAVKVDHPAARRAGKRPRGRACHFYKTFFFPIWSLRHLFPVGWEKSGNCVAQVPLPNSKKPGRVKRASCVVRGEIRSSDDASDANRAFRIVNFSFFDNPIRLDRIAGSPGTQSLAHSSSVLVLPLHA
ncbi:hypothetical protein GQ53DRAFT_366958 [Thozetella sp. PMI_491]|nr:hypothetical protein GQ53DRAFT_366958 [Thozetella sp. PMI_491]